MKKNRLDCKLFGCFLLSCCLLEHYILVQGEQCQSEKVVYGENRLIDELSSCSLARLFDLDLTPNGEHTKSTGRPLVEQGVSNKTSILHARLSGLWTMRRADFIETAWKCAEDKLRCTSILEVTNLSLEVIEKLDVTINKNQHKLASHKPCKTFDLAPWMCRHQKPVYRSITTWVNRAFFSLKLGQLRNESRPTIESLSMMFSCPETFRQKISYSPSASYVLTRHLQSAAPKVFGKRNVNNLLDSSHSTTQSGKLPAVPPYHNSVRVIQHRAIEALRSALTECIGQLDSDLTLMAEHTSFKTNRYNHSPSSQGQTDQPFDQPPDGLVDKCANKLWLKNRVELSEQAGELGASDGRQQDTQTLAAHSKRSQSLIDYPSDPNQLLDPYSYYYQNSAGQDRMIDDTR